MQNKARQGKVLAPICADDNDLNHSYCVTFVILLPMPYNLTPSKAQILFLDIEMPHMSGFDLLEKIPSIDFELIFFTTSYDQYAIKAIRFGALDYLLKPIDRDDLQKAVQKATLRFVINLLAIRN